MSSRNTDRTVTGRLTIDPDVARRAVSAADMRALLMMVFHHTGDRYWLGERFRPVRDIRLIAPEDAGLPADVRDEIAGRCNRSVANPDAPITCAQCKRGPRRRCSPGAVPATGLFRSGHARDLPRQTSLWKQCQSLHLQSVEKVAGLQEWACEFPGSCRRGRCRARPLQRSSTSRFREAEGRGCRAQL